MILPLMLLVAACQPAAVEQHVATTGPDVDAVTTAFQQSVAAANAGDVETLFAVYADDAVSMPPSAPPWVGKAAIRAALEPQFAESAFQLTVSPDDIAVAGDLAVIRTGWEETVTPRDDGETTGLHGEWLLVWRKQADGSWKIWRDMWTVVPPATPEAGSM